MLLQVGSLGGWVDPLVGSVVLEVVIREHLVRLHRSPGAVLVRDWISRTRLDLVQQRCEYPPRLCQLVTPTGTQAGSSDGLH